MIIYIVIELVVALYRIPFMKHLVNLDMRKYVNDVLLPLLPLGIVVTSASLLLSRYVNMQYGFRVVVFIGMILGVCAMWAFCLSKDERQYVVNFIKRRQKEWE